MVQVHAEEADREASTSKLTNQVSRCTHMNTGGTGKYERLAGCTPESVGIPKRGERWDTLNFGINRPSKADISRGRPVAQGRLLARAAIPRN